MTFEEVIDHYKADSYFTLNPSGFHSAGSGWNSRLARRLGLCSHNRNLIRTVHDLRLQCDWDGGQHGQRVYEFDELHHLPQRRRPPAACLSSIRHAM